MEEGDPAALKTEYLDVIVSDVRTTNGLGFSVQILNTEGHLFSFLIDFLPGRKLTIFLFDNRDRFSRATYERVFITPQDGRTIACWLRA